MKCCICKGEIKGYGNNAEPVKKGTCCDRCNYKIVVPVRFAFALREIEQEKK